jgi:TPR repeat protein
MAGKATFAIAKSKTAAAAGEAKTASATPPSFGSRLVAPQAAQPALLRDLLAVIVMNDEAAQHEEQRHAKAPGHIRQPLDQGWRFLEFQEESCSMGNHNRKGGKEPQPGVGYDNGRGLRRDDAASWCRKAADESYAMAQFNLGNMYANGRGVPQDHAATLSWYRKAADQGNAEAQFNLGVMYEKGDGVPQDYAAAVNWYSKAADPILAPLAPVPGIEGLAADRAIGMGTALSASRVAVERPAGIAWLDLGAAGHRAGVEGLATARGP